MVGVFAAKTKDGVARGRDRRRALRVPRARDGSGVDEDLPRPTPITGITVEKDAMNSDIHGSAEYRAHLVTVMARRAVAEAA